jgi:glutamate decarboxylase
MPTFALNFSRPGAQVLLQYYNFLRLGREGYRSVQQASQDVANHVAERIAAMAPFELWADGPGIPVFAWRLKPGYTSKWDLYDLGNQLRQQGWLVPAYPLPGDLSDITVQRVVVRNGLSMDLADALLDDIAAAVEYLDGLDGPLPREGRKTMGFHH